jgi:hypothetical protein
MDFAISLTIRKVFPVCRDQYKAHDSNLGGMVRKRFNVNSYDRLTRMSETASGNIRFLLTLICSQFTTMIGTR